MSLDAIRRISKNHPRQLIPTMNWTIRCLTMADYEAVLRLWRESEGVGLNESDAPGPVESFLARNPGLSRVAFDGCALVGAVLCGHDGRRGYLHHLAVAKSHRQQGIGKALVAACLGDLARTGIPKCNIFLLADNHAGGAFWEHNGWAKRADLLVMQIPLPRHPGEQPLANSPNTGCQSC